MIGATKKKHSNTAAQVIRMVSEFGPSNQAVRGWAPGLRIEIGRQRVLAEGKNSRCSGGRDRNAVGKSWLQRVDIPVWDRATGIGYLVDAANERV